MLLHHDSELENEVKGRQECAKADHSDWRIDESRAEGLNLSETDLILNPSRCPSWHMLLIPHSTLKWVKDVHHGPYTNGLLAEDILVLGKLRSEKAG